MRNALKIHHLSRCPRRICVYNNEYLHTSLARNEKSGERLLQKPRRMHSDDLCIQMDRGRGDA